MAGEHILHSGVQLSGLTSRAFDVPLWQFGPKLEIMNHFEIVVKLEFQHAPYMLLRWPTPGR